jgi:hypothetical protein
MFISTSLTSQHVIIRVSGLFFFFSTSIYPDFGTSGRVLPSLLHTVLIASRPGDDFGHQGRRDTKKWPKILKLLKHTDMAIPWKALEEHFLMVHVPFVLRFNHLRGKREFYEFFAKQPLSLKS